MAVPKTPRSVTDATRFTAQIPHATMKASPISSRRKAPASRKPLAHEATAPRFHVETPEERISRLRAAHLAAKDAELSSFDKLVVRVRPWMDSAHRMTVLGLIGFTCVAAVVTVYTAVDMLRYNRSRKNDFFALSKIAETDNMLAARLAYVRGGATEEQTRMVEELQATAQKQGVKLPPLFQDDGVTPRMTPEEARALETQDQEITAMAAISNGEQQSSKKAWSWKEWALGNLKREEEGDYYGSKGARLGYESLSEEDDSAVARDSDIIRAIEQKKEWTQQKVESVGETIQEKAKDAFQKERERQARGGPLDQLGLETEKKNRVETEKKKMWLW